MIDLRPYQQQAVEELRACYRRKCRAPLYQLPTGGGKTYVFAYIAMQAAARGNSVLILVHRKELLTQASMSLAKIGVQHNLIAQPQHIREAMFLHIQAFNQSFVNIGSPVTVASVDSLIRRFDRVQPPKLIICDEAHHLLKTNKWGKVIFHFPNARILGVTATPCRSDGKGLGVDSNGFFDALVKGCKMQQLIDDGFLLRPKVFAPPTKLDASKIKTTRGDYDQKQLAEATDEPPITGDAIEHYAKICPHVPAIAFCVSINHARHVSEQFNAAGFVSRVIDGTMPDAERRANINALAHGKIDVLTSCDIVSEGTDIPVVGCGILLRKTKSEALYLQQTGRVLRPYKGQTDAIILDHVGNCLEFGLPEAEREWTLDGLKKRTRKNKQEKFDVKIVQCPECFFVHAPAPKCPNCGHIYETKNSDDPEVNKDENLHEVKGAEAEFLRRQRHAEIQKAKTLDDFRAIGRARGYSPKWAQIMFMRRTKIANSYWKWGAR
jgi:superfamily II DNA or RNA helicase